MIVKIIGTNEGADRARALLTIGGARIVDRSPIFTFTIAEIDAASPYPIVDGVHSELEARFVTLLTELTKDGIVTLKRKGGNQDDRSLVVHVPANEEARHAVAQAIYRTVAQLTQGTKAPRRRWRDWFGVFVLILLWASSAIAQQTTGAVQITDNTNGPATVVAPTVLPATATNAALVVTLRDSATVTLASNASVNVNQLAGTATAVNSGVKDAGTLRVVIATDQPALANKLLVTPDSVALPANQSVNVSQINAVTPLMGNGVTGTGSQRVTIASDNTAFSVNASPPSLTKGTQQGTGYTVQSFIDAGRTAISFYANNFASGATTAEKIITWDQSKGTGAITAATASYTITNNKTLRITALSVASRGNATATVQSTVFSLRLNNGGACIATSTPILFAAQSATAAVASDWDRVIIPIPDGYEIAGDGTRSICITGNATFVTNAPTWSVNLLGFEY